jgi:uncharacterized membrane protein YkvA (DUF1232 family)
LGRLWTLLALRRPLGLIWRLLRDHRVPLATKLPIPLAVLFLLSPIGLRLSLVPVLGEVGVATILILAVVLFLRLCPRDVVREHVGTMAGRPTSNPKKDSGDVIEGDYEILE